MATQVFQGITQLSPSELKETIARAHFLLGGEEPPEEEDSASLAYTAAIEVGRQYFGTRLPPWSLVLRRQERKPMVDGLSSLAPSIESWFATRTQNQLFGAWHNAFESLGLFLKDRDIPYRLRTITQSLDSIPHAIDRSYPGYRESGLLGVLIGTKTISQARDLEANSRL